LGYVAQQRVAHVVPERIVDRLKVIQIDAQHGDGRAVSARKGQRLFYTIS
jgi:hypothetical protein